MTFVTHYSSPVGDLLLASDGEYLTGLWLEGQKYYAAGLENPVEDHSLPIFGQITQWLDEYFSGKRPSIADLPLAPRGGEYRQRVWELLKEIPYGSVTTYGALAARLNSSPRAVGGAVGRNPLSIIIPCHRVVGAAGELTGYAGGVDRKRFLLELERGEGSG